MKNEENIKPTLELEEIKASLKAIVLILLRTHLADENGKIKLSDAAPLLHLAGYKQTEMAKILRQKSFKNLAKYLYPKKK